MKQQKMLTAALLLSALASCSSDDNADFLSNPQTVKFTSQISNQEPANTRAGATTWDSDDAIGVFMTPYGEVLSAERALANNKRYVTELGGASGNFIPAIASEVVQFPTDGTSVDFVAYYPYQSSLSSFVYPIDITTQSSQAAIDLLYSNSSRQMTATTTNVGLKFKHQLSKIVFAISSTSINDLSGLTVAIKGVNTKADFDLTTGTLTVDHSTTGNVNAVVATTGTSGEAILIPDADLASHTLVFTLIQGETALSWEETLSTIYVANKKYTYNVALDKNASGDTTVISISLGDTEIEDWEDAPAENIVPGGTGDEESGGEETPASDDIPDGYAITTLAADADLEEALAAFSGKVAVVLSQGGNYTLASRSPVALPEGITGLVVLGEAGDDMPVITTKGLSFENGSMVELIKFQNIHFIDASTQSSYVMNVNTAFSCTDLIIKECLIEDVRGVVRVQTAGASVANIDIENCIINNIGSYGIVSCQLDAVTIDSVTLSSSTINGITGGRTFDFNNMSNLTVSVEACTFYKAPGNDFVRVSSGSSVSITVNDCLFGSFNSTAVKGCSQSGYVTAENTYYTTDNVWTSNGFGTAYNGSAADLFVDPAHADFRIRDSNFTASSGDPRWK